MMPFTKYGSSKKEALGPEVKDIEVIAESTGLDIELLSYSKEKQRPKTNLFNHFHGLLHRIESSTLFK